MWQRFTESARRPLFIAQQTASAAGECYVRTEHLLDALLRASHSPALSLLGRLGLEPAHVSAELKSRSGRGTPAAGRDMRLTPWAKRAVDLAHEEAQGLGDRCTGSEHLLLGLLREEEGLAGRVLRDLGADLEQARAETVMLSELRSEGSLEEGDPVEQAFYRLATPRAVMAYSLCRGEARLLRADEGRPIHLLLAMTRHPGCAAAAILEKAGVVAANLQKETVGRHPRPAVSAAPSLSAGARCDPSVELREVLAAALRERVRLGDETVSTRHLLLGILAAPESEAAALLVTLGGNLDEIRRLAETAGIEDGVPQVPTMRVEGVPGRRGEGLMWQRFTEKAREAVFYAQEEAARFAQQEVGPEHLLLGLLRVLESRIPDLLAEFGINAEDFRDELAGQLTQGEAGPETEMQLSQEGKRAIELAAEASGQRFTPIMTWHLLIGIARVEGVAAAMLRQAGADPERLRGPAEKLSQPASGEGPDTLSFNEFFRSANSQARMSVILAKGEAGLHRAEETGSEHVLAALTRGPKCAASQILERAGLPPDRVFAELVRQFPRPPTTVSREQTCGRRPLSAGAYELLRRALAERERRDETSVNTRHLLVALLQEEDGGAGSVLRALGADLPQLLAAVQADETEDEREPVREAQTSPAAAMKSTGGGGRMWQRFTERARRVVFFSQEEAARLGQSYVGTEHLLLGVVRESDSVAARILFRLGVPLEQIREDIQRQVTRGHGNLGQDMQLTPRAKRVIDLAYEEARQLNNNYIGTEHLLLGLIREGDGLTARVLVKLGADLERTRREVYAMQEGEMASTPTAMAFLTKLRRRLAAVSHAETAAVLGETPAPADPTEAPVETESPVALLRWLAEQMAEQEVRLMLFEGLNAAVTLSRQVCEGLKHFRSIGELNADQVWALLSLARVLKHTIKADKTCQNRILAGKTLAMIFEKQSLRTRASFETGMFQFGGHAIYLQPSDIAMGQREPVCDVARNLSRMVDGIMARVYAHATIQELAEHASIPVISGLCDREHPCQALADLMTVWEKRGEIAGQKIAYVGDGNNVAHSLMLLGAKLGAHVVIACPKGYHPDPGLVAVAEKDAAVSGGSVTVVRDPADACRDADVVYTDVWTSMGQEKEAAERAVVFQPYQVNEALVSVAKPDYLFLHCLPAHRGEEVSAAVMDGPHSAVFDQAENRLHAQKAVLAVLMG